MPTSIWRDEVQRLIREETALLIEVLPTQEYEDEHIEGAINIPLKRPAMLLSGFAQPAKTRAS